MPPRDKLEPGNAALLACLEAFARGSDEADAALPWASRLAPRDRERLRADLDHLLSEPEDTGEPLDSDEITEVLCDWAKVAEWEGPLVQSTGPACEHRFSVEFHSRDDERLACAPPAVQRAMQILLTQFLPEHPTDGERLPRGQLKKLNERNVWQIDLSDAYRLRYLVDKPARIVHIVYFGPHPAGDPRGREESVRARVQRQRNENLG